MALKPLVPADLNPVGYDRRMEAGFTPQQQLAAINPITYTPAQVGDIANRVGTNAFAAGRGSQTPDLERGVASLQEMFEDKRDVYRGILGDPEEQRSAAQSQALFTIANFGLQLAGATGGRVGASLGEKIAQAAETSKVFPTISALSQQQRESQQKLDLAALAAAETERTAALKAEQERRTAADKPQKPDYKTLVSADGQTSLGVFDVSTARGRVDFGKAQAANAGSYPGTPDIKDPLAAKYQTLVSSDGQSSLGVFDVSTAQGQADFGKALAANAGSYPGTPKAKDFETPDLYEVSGVGSDGKSTILGTINLKTAMGVNRLNKIREAAEAEGVTLKFYKVGTAPEADSAGGLKVGDLRSYSLPPDVAEQYGIAPRGLVNPVSQDLVQGSRLTGEALANLAQSFREPSNRFGMFTIGGEPAAQPTERVLKIDLPEEGLFAGQRVDVDALTRLGVNVRKVTTSPQSFDVFSNLTLLNKFAFGEDNFDQNMLIQQAIDERTAPTTVNKANALGLMEQVQRPGLQLPAQWLSALKTRADIASSNKNVAMPSYWRSISEEQKQAIPEFSRLGSQEDGVPGVITPMVAGALMPGGPVAAGGRATPDLNSADFNKFLFEDGDFQKKLDTNSPQWLAIPGMADDDLKEFRDDITRIGGLGSAIPATAQFFKEVARELGIGSGLDENDRSFRRMRRMLNNVQSRGLQIITQSQGDQDRILKLVQDKLAEQVEGVQADVFTTDESTLNALTGLEDLFASTLQQLGEVLPEYGGGNRKGYTEDQITGARSDARSIRSLLSDVIALRKAYDFGLGTYATGAGGDPSDEGRKKAQELLNRFNEPR